MALQEQGERAPIGVLLAARWDEDSSVREAVDNTLGQYFDGQEGQKIVPSSTNWLSSSWLRLALALLSVGSLIPLTNLPTNSPYIGRFGLVSELTATTMICLAIALINILYQRIPIGMSSTQKRTHQQGTTMPLQNVMLAGFSVFTLTQIAYSLLMATGFAYDPTMNADAIHFILMARLIALGVMTATVIVINKVFFVKR